MFIRTLGAGPAPARAEPTSLLALIAGEFALQVARLWPAPHVEFVAAPAARRHLVCLGFVLGRDVAALREVLIQGRLKAAVAAVAGERAPGLLRAIERLGEVAWPAEAYRKLLALLAQPRAAKALRHAETIELELVQRLGDLPGPMAGAVELALVLDREQVGLLRESHDVLRWRVGEAAAAEVVAGWERFETPKALFAAVRDDLCPEPATPPHDGAPRLRPLTTKAAFRDAARRYRNCLVDQAPYAASGWSAYYEWTGDPGAMIEISRDHIFGWRLEQARLAGNEPVPEALREQIVSELALMGVHVGRGGWELERALSQQEDHRYPVRPVEAAVAEAFGAE